MSAAFYDVIITGGSYAGLSAAMTLGRAGRRVLILDSGEPCNRQTPFSHNFLTRDGETPAAIAALAREQVLRYPTITCETATVTAAQQHEHGFSVQAADGANYMASRLLFATGVRDLLPAIPGFSECWGISLLHCPYCHGYEVKDQPTAILASGDIAFHRASLLRNWTAELSIYTNGPSGLNPEQLEQLAHFNIPLMETPVQALQHENGQLQSIKLEDGSSPEYKVIYALPSCEQHCDIPGSLGCSLTETGLIETADSGRTTNDKVFAAGDNSNVARTIATAVASGTLAAITINNDLCAESFRRQP